MKRDFITECNTDRLPFKEFMAAWCQKCRNSACRNAGWGTSKWISRMATQEDRLLNNPFFADSEDPSFDYVREVDFPDLLKQAVRLEIASRNNDWEIPAEEEVDKKVEDQKLHSAPELDKTAISSTEHGVEEDGISQVPPDSSDDLPENSSEIPPLPSDSSPVPPRFMGNTPFPSEGMMVDGSVPVDSTPVEAAQPEDPWAPKTDERKVKVGATITLGGSKKS